MSESQAGIQLTLQFVHLALRDAQLILRGGLLLRQGSSLGTGLLLLSGDDRLLLMRYIPAQGVNPETYRIESGAASLSIVRGKEKPEIGRAHV